MLGQLARRRLRAAHHLGSVAGSDEVDPHGGGPATWATAATTRSATCPPASSASRARPASTSRDRSASSVRTRCSAAATYEGSPAFSRSAADPDRLTYGADGPGHDGNSCRHRLEERDAEALMGREREIHVGRAEMCRQRGVGHLAGDPHRLGQTQVLDETTDCLEVLEARRATDDVQARPASYRRR